MRRGCTTSMSWCSSSSWSPISAARCRRSAIRRCSSASCNGVDFFWPAKHLWLPTAFVAGCVLAIFVVIDLLVLRAGSPRRAGRRGERSRFGVRGAGQPVAARGHHRRRHRLGAVEAGIAFDDLRHDAAELQNLLRDAVLVLIALASLWLTPDEHREANGFSWEPILEVAILFAGIFVCASCRYGDARRRPRRRVRLAPAAGGDGA